MVDECAALVREVGEGTNTTANPEMVALVRKLVELSRATRQPVAGGLAAWSYARANGATVEEQVEASEPYAEELRALQSEMDDLIVRLAEMAPVS